MLKPALCDVLHLTLRETIDGWNDGLGAPDADYHATGVGDQTDINSTARPNADDTGMDGNNSANDLTKTDTSEEDLADTTAKEPEDGKETDPDSALAEKIKALLVEYDVTDVLMRHEDGMLYYDIPLPSGTAITLTITKVAPDEGKDPEWTLVVLTPDEVYMKAIPEDDVVDKDSGAINPESFPVNFLTDIVSKYESQGDEFESFAFKQGVKTGQLRNLKEAQWTSTYTKEKKKPKWTKGKGGKEKMKEAMTFAIARLSHFKREVMAESIKEPIFKLIPEDFTLNIVLESQFYAQHQNEVLKTVTGVALLSGSIPVLEAKLLEEQGKECVLLALRFCEEEKPNDVETQETAKFAREEAERRVKQIQNDTISMRQNGAKGGVPNGGEKPAKDVASIKTMEDSKYRRNMEASLLSINS